MRRIGVGEVRIGAKAKANVLTALDADRLSYGPFSREFERRFAGLHSRRFAAFVNSGTSALQIALAALKEKHGWRDGDGILVPAVTFVASINTITQNGLKPVVVDVDPEYLDMSVYKAGEAVRRSKVVGMMPVNLFGGVADTCLLRLAEVLHLRTVVDSCEAMFVPGCAEGDVSCFSTYACHLINTGVGGLATTNDPDLAYLIRSLANHGRDGIYRGIDDELGDAETMAARFRFERVGYSYRATELEAAIGCAELDGWQDNIARRQHNADRLLARLADLPVTLPKVRTTSSRMMFPILYKERDLLTQHLESLGVETRPLLPITNQPVYQWIDEDKYPVARRVNEQGFYVGCHQYMADDDVDYVADAVKSFFER